MNYPERMANLRRRKAEQTAAKLRQLGIRNEDDYGCVLPPADFKVELPCRDENGSFFGAYAWGKNFRWLMEHHPAYIDPDDALAGRWMFMLSRMRLGYKLELANFPFDYSHLKPEQIKYDITCGIGKDAHFAPDYEIGLQLGWGGLLEKAHAAREQFAENPEARELFDAEIDAIEGVQCWVCHLAEAADKKSRSETDPVLRNNLESMAAINYKLIASPPETLREACQWIAHFNMASRTYNRDGAGGQLDELLRPYYERDRLDGIITDADAEFYIFCLLLNDPHYYQLGGPPEDGHDQTSHLSYIILDAAEKLNSSCNLTIRVFDGMDRGLFRRGVEVLLKNKQGYPRFSGDMALVKGFMRNGYSAELARKRIATGCNWMSLPGLEYTLNDVVKINLAKVFEVAWQEVTTSSDPTLEKLWEAFTRHFCRAAEVTCAGIDFHLEHQHLNEPELMLNLLSHGPLEKGLDVSNGGAQYYNMAIDGAGLATVADSFAAIEQRIEQEKRLTWKQTAAALENNFDVPDGERIRRLLLNSERYGAGDSLGDRWALRLTKLLQETLGNRITPGGRKIIPGWFSWADTLRFGKTVGATPNGRRAQEPISHGANPNPGFRKDGALTAMSTAIASVQPGFGNTAPWQLELDLGVANAPECVDLLMALINTHFQMGGTLININIVDAEKILAAHEQPELYPDLVVRVTGFSAYFTSLSKEFRQLVVNRLIQEAV